MEAMVGKMMKEAAKKAGILKQGRHGIQYAIEPSQNGKQVVTVWKGKANKPLLRYLVRDFDKALEYVARATISQKMSADRKAKANEESQARKAEMADKVNVGSIFCYSWGYEQTNIEFFQVVAKKGQTVRIRRIASETVPGSEYSHGMACKVRPVKDAFIRDETLTKRIGPYGLSMEFGSCNLISEDSEHYCSWYA